MPAADAKSKANASFGNKARTAITNYDKKQNQAIRRARRRARRAHRRIVTLKEFAFGLAANNRAQQETLDGVNAVIAQVVAGVPQIVGGLEALEGGLLSLKGVLENTVAPALKALEGGLTQLGSAYSAVEYGVAKVFASGASTPTVAAGSTTISADVPDDGNSIQTNETAIIVAGANGLMSIDVKADIRSNESDNGAGATVGQAGGFLYVENLDTGARVDCTGGSANPPGIIGTLPGDSIVTPSGTVTNLPLKNLPGGVGRTDTTHPDSSSTSLLPAACGFAAAVGTTYAAHYSVNFVDIPTSTTPGPTE